MTAPSVTPEVYNKRTVPIPNGDLNAWARQTASWLSIETGNIVRAIPSGWTWPPLDGEAGVRNLKYYYGDVRRYGAVGDGVTDDTKPIQRAVTFAIAFRAAVFVPSGYFLYSDSWGNITQRCAIIGAGSGLTYFVPDASYDGWALTIEECHRTDAQGGVDATTIAPIQDYSANVALQGFSIAGDRATDANGIATIGRVDLLSMVDVKFFDLKGTALQLGRQDAVGAGKGGVVRESEFVRLRIEHCGDEANDLPALDITTSATATDGTNQLSFVELKCVYNNWTTVLLECLNTNAARNTRRITFTDFMLHGVHGITGGDPACDLMQITGAVTDVNVYGFKSNNSNTASGTNYAAIRLGSNASGKPDAIVMDGDVRAMGGDAYVIDACSNATFRGTAGVTGSSLELKLSAAPDQYLRYDVLSGQGQSVRAALLSVASEAAAVKVQGIFADQYQATFADADATPDVFCVGDGGAITANSGATTITDLDNGRDGQVVVIVANDANTTIQNGANIKTKTGANVVMTLGQTITLWHQNSTLWREI